MMLPLLAVAALPNLRSVVMVLLMSTSVKVLVDVLKTPTPSASQGAKMTLPLLAVAAPTNLSSVLMVLLMSTRLKVSVDGSKTPTPSAW